MGLSERDYMRNPEPGQISNFTAGVIVITFLAIVFLLPRMHNFSFPLYSTNSSDQSFKEQIARIDPTYNRQQRLAKISPIDINTAPYEDVILLPRISRTVATGIVSGRPYFEIEQLDDVFGIGQKRIELYRPHIQIDNDTLKASFPEQFEKHRLARADNVEPIAN